MKSVVTVTMASIIHFGAASSNELAPIPTIKPSVAKEGSLANEKLIADVTADLVESANIQADTKIVKFVIQQPVGSAGQRAWREMWIVDPGNSPMQFIVTFKEVGLDAADFEVQKM